MDKGRRLARAIGSTVRLFLPNLTGRREPIAAAAVSEPPAGAARYSMLLVLAAPCPHSAEPRPHAWLPGDLAELVGLGRPHHGLAVHLGRCRRCGMPLLKVEALAEAIDEPITYEVRGAEL
jgi:hypothetical protein